MSAILNIAAYRFVAIDDPSALRARLQTVALAQGLLGTILLASEGINLFLAGTPDGVAAFLAQLRGDPRFAGALDLGLNRFSEFPAAVAAASAALAGHTVVSYCTGGIRCEKAALYMNELGLQHHYQLDGGILNYFEQVGGAHYEGHCTVFDARNALTPDLAAE